MTTPYYTDERVTLYHGDCLDVLAAMPDASVDAIVTDPPYGLGFMGKAWDDLPPGEPWARECLRVLKPGGHLLAFGGTRTWHRLACAVEDAGFEMRDSIAWLYGSGFPKSLDVSKAIDKRANVNDETRRRVALVAEIIRTHREAKGMERAAVSLAVVGTPSGACWNWEHQQLPSAEMWPAIKRVLDIPDRFDGLIEGTRAQFIGAEREVIATGYRVRRESTVQIVGLSDGEYDLTAPATDAAREWAGWGTALKPAFEPIVVARKPLAGTVAANVLAHGTGALNIDATRIGTTDSLCGGANKGMTAETRHEGFARPWMRDDEAREAAAARSRENTARAESMGRWPANVVLDESQAAALDEQSGTSESRIGKPRGAASGDGWGMTATGAEYADSGGASRFFYTAKAASAERPKAGKVAHPTVKPLDLMRWLVRLVTPPGGVVLDPFAGSGTTLEAAIVEGFRCIGIEREADYLPLIDQRIARACPPLDFTEATA